MAYTSLGSNLGPSFLKILMAGDIEPGQSPSYELCKLIYLYHPLGAKMAEAPIQMAQSQAREIDVAGGPKEDLLRAFHDEWEAIHADQYILQARSLARVYGASALCCLQKDKDPNEPLEASELYNKDISFSVYDPLNVAGSLVLQQTPNTMDFLKTTTIRVQGQQYHPSRARICLNEMPVYLGYTNSAFGYVGRSVYQRALFPLKSFIQSMITDDMVTRKAGLIIAMIKQAGSIIDQAAAWITGQKRQLLKEAQVDNVLSIGVDEKVETLNMQNLDGAYGMARKNVLENIAVSADMPAKILNSETFVEGFGEGTEDAKNIARYVERERITMRPLYQFFDEIVMFRAWNGEFFKTLQTKYPDEEFLKRGYNAAFQDWQNSFTAKWPSLLIEPDSERSKGEKVKLEAIIQLCEVMLPIVDPVNKQLVLEWACDNFNEFQLLFASPLILDTDELEAYLVEQASREEEAHDTEMEGADASTEGARANAEATLNPPEPKKLAPPGARKDSAKFLPRGGLNGKSRSDRHSS